jgi:hypothetical protein
MRVVELVSNPVMRVLTLIVCLTQPALAQGVEPTIKSEGIKPPAKLRRRHVLPPHRFAFSHDDLRANWARDHQDPSYTGHSLDPSSIRRARQSVTEKVGDFRARTAFYPAIGFDAGTAQLFFPEATTIIGVDAHPFFSRGEFANAAQPISYGRLGAQNAINTAHIDSIGAVGRAVLSQLATLVHDFRLRRVTTFGDEEDRGHATVLYDTGPGTALRRYIHINDQLNDQSPGTWWWKEIERLGPDAVLTKGGQGVLEDKHLVARSEVIGWLRKNKGIFIQADRKYDPKSLLPTVDLELQGQRFGYHRWLSVTRY